MVYKYTTKSFNTCKQHFARSYLARSNMCPNTPNTVFGARIWARQIWSSGVFLKRSCKMQFRRIDLASIGPPSQKLRPNFISSQFKGKETYLCKTRFLLAPGPRINTAQKLFSKKRCLRETP